MELPKHQSGSSDVSQTGSIDRKKGSRRPVTAMNDENLDFISSQEWTPHSPYLNPLDYWVWDILQELVYEGRREPFANFKDKWHDVALWRKTS